MRKRKWLELLNLPKMLDCLLWQGARDSSGHGVVLYTDGKYWSTHRLSFRLNIGEIPKDTLVLHACGKANCINPAHLYLGDHIQNNQDRQRHRGTYQASGEATSYSILKESDVKAIRLWWHQIGCVLTMKQLADQFGVSKGCISEIVYNKTWKGINP